MHLACLFGWSIAFAPWLRLTARPSKAWQSPQEHRAHPFCSVHLFKTCALAILQRPPRTRPRPESLGLHYFWQLSLTMVKSVTVM